MLTPSFSCGHQPTGAHQSSSGVHSAPHFPQLCRAFLRQTLTNNALGHGHSGVFFQECCCTGIPTFDPCPKISGVTVSCSSNVVIGSRSYKGPSPVPPRSGLQQKQPTPQPAPSTQSSKPAGHGTWSTWTNCPPLVKPCSLSLSPLARQPPWRSCATQHGAHTSPTSPSPPGFMVVAPLLWQPPG